MTMQDIRELYRYDEWASNRTLDSVSPLSEEQFKRDLKSSHGDIHGTLVHICAADRIWLARWKGISPGALMTVEQLPTFDALTEAWKSFRMEIAAFLEPLDDRRLQEPCEYKDMKGNQNSQPLYQQLLHKVNHATYHRGQIVTMLRQLGGKPQNTDLIGFYRTLQR